MPANSVTFSPFAVAQTKFVVMGPPGALHRRVSDSARSLKETEFVSAAEQFRSEAARMTPLGVVCRKALAAGHTTPEDVAIAILRRWFWSRKSSRAFVMTGFPATVAQAIVLDEWLDARDEVITAPLWLEQSESAALAEADDAQVCPQDGSVYYPSRETLLIPGCCDVCRSSLQSDSVRARAEVRSWFSTSADSARAVAGYYRQQGSLISVDADRPLEAALADLGDIVRPFLADR